MIGRLSLCLLLLVLFGCGQEFPRWRHEARIMYDRVRLIGAAQEYPQEFSSMEQALFKGERLEDGGDSDEAGKFYLLALTKGNLLQQKFMAAEAERRAAEERRAEEQKRALERQHAEFLEQRRQALARAEAEAEALEQAELRKRREQKPTHERYLPVSYTVKRGESLPQIASKQEIYNDSSLWPLIYRANRDQISDPAHIWPGQVLRIPRNLTRNEVTEAHRYSQERPLR